MTSPFLMMMLYYFHQQLRISWWDLLIYLAESEMSLLEMRIEAHLLQLEWRELARPLLLRNFSKIHWLSENFECRLFVPIGQKFLSEKFIRSLSDQVNPNRENLIVLDDVWDQTSWINCEKIFTKSHGSAILVTSRLQDDGDDVDDANIFHMRFMNKEESWDLLRGKVFGEEVCPPQFEKAGRKIAENCEGLPLLIVTVADQLSKADKTPEHWNKVAADKQNSVFEEAYDQILEVLYPSYLFLTQEEKSLFLYMSVFPQDYQIRTSRLLKLLRAEDLLDIHEGRDKRNVQVCLDKLISCNVVVLNQGGSFSRVEVCSFHSVFWYLSKKEARINKVHHNLYRYSSSLAENLEKERRLSIYKNVLFCIKDVYHSVASMSKCTFSSMYRCISSISGTHMFRFFDVAEGT